MKDKDDNFREYANDGSIKCADCRCAASRHRITNVTRYSADKKVLLNQRIGWIAYIKSWVPPLPGLPTLPSLRLNFSAYFGTPTPKAPVKRYELEAFQDVREFIDKTLMDFPAMIQLFPEADGESEILNEFEKRMQYGSLALFALGVLGFLGFRGRNTGLEFLTNLYASMIMTLSAGALISYYAFKHTKSEAKKTLTAIFVTMNIFSVMTYILIYTGLTPKVYGPLGIPIQSARFVEWLVSIPSWVRIFGQLTGSQKDPEIFVRQTQGYLLTFVFASGLLSPWCEWAGGVGLFLFLTAFHGVQDMFLKSINGETKSQLDENSLLFARQMIWVSSIATPATWLLSAVGALGYAEAELIYSLSDIGTKVILTSVIAAGEITV